MSLGSRGWSITSAMQRRLVPDLRYSQTHFEEFLTGQALRASAWLDLGCGHQLLPEWRAEAERMLLKRVPLVVGVDYDLESLLKHRTIHELARADARQLPFADDTFDLVTANMVVEHLDDPAAQFAEVRRVLRPGGAFLFHTPNARSYFVATARLLPDGLKRRVAKFLDGRDESDVFPTLYRANRPEDVAEVAASAGLEVADVTLVSSAPVLGAIPPVAAVELVVLRALQRPSLARYRSNMICTLRKPAAVSAPRRVPVAAAS
ncbi:Methyltransferase type 11 [Gemmatirosa kalamazoonensis]|uniref:Methyltransferase type 11 n=2 Tax=Gemmatirosa kalamazoonensis TaxID=861299 RepID=W0RHY3_9BACT|nr:Methyltransferase type 11 [Gemmatirosa kalamazoonensis]